MFLTPSGRFDINVDVCLSVTKYHKEEWQAAWTIRTMLEAIIAFFPIREDHDAIGAIDYPIEARKKFAVQSRKYKCDICGPIIDLLPEKKQKSVVSTTQPTETEKATVNIPEQCEISSDNKSDNSLNEKVEASPENKQIKREKSSKMKKIELDRKSHLSQIEGVIFEDVNEYAENEEEIDLNMKRHQTDIISEDNNRVNEKVEINNEQIKRYNSDNINTDFSEYLRKLRQSQFEKEEKTEYNNINENENILTEEINFKPKSNPTLVYNKPMLNHKVQTEEPIKKQELNFLRETSKEEMEFCEIISTIKFHKSKTSEEIYKELEENKNLNDIKDMDNSNIGDLLTKLLEKETKKNGINTNNINKEQFNQMMTLITGQGELEKLLKQKSNLLKYVTKKNYKSAKLNRLRGVNIIMGLLIIAIFGVYYYYKNYA